MSNTQKLSKDLLSRSRVIAKGRRIPDVARLVETHGGRASLWVKKSSPRLELESEVCEYHWYEHRGIGRFEVKLKRRNQ